LGIHDIKTRLVHIFNTLFENETAQKASVDIEEFLEELEAAEYNNYFEIYQKYEALYEKLNNSDGLQSVKPNTLIFRIWNKAKSLMKFVKPVLIITVLALIICYLIYSIIHRPVDATAVSNFEQIGTVAIQPDQGK
jgi:hypothetical protein